MQLVATFMGKVQQVKHHALVSNGNTAVETPFIEPHNATGYQKLLSYDTDYYGQSISEGWQFINIATSANKKKMRVKFYADNGHDVRNYLWNFGDEPWKEVPFIYTINREIEHTYDLTTRDTWMQDSGDIPILGLPGRTGRWTQVFLRVQSLDGAYVWSDGTFIIYELDATTEVIDGDWQCTIPSLPEEYQCIIASGIVDNIQAIS